MPPICNSGKGTEMKQVAQPWQTDRVTHAPVQ